MSHYKSNIRDIEFNLFEVLGREEVLGTGLFEEVDTDTAKSVLAEVDRLAREEIAASFEDADRNPPVYDPATHSVKMPTSFDKSYQAFMDAEWYRLQLPTALGGQPAPASLIWSVAELVLGANASTAAAHVPGLGLGLYISREIANAHHGRLEVEGALGEGAVFRLCLPSRNAGTNP